MRSLLSTLILSSSLVSLVATGCTKNSDSTSDDDSPQSAVDSAETSSSEGDMMMAAVDGSATAQLPDATSLTATIATNIQARFSPQGCATVTTDGTNIKTVYADCTGPRGLVHVTGELDLAVSVSTAGAITVQGSGTGVKVNGATLDVDATGTYAVTGTSHTLTVQTQGSGVGLFGRDLDHEGNYTISWDPSTQCSSIDGTWSTDIGAHNRGNTVMMSACAGACPTGSVVHNFLGDRSLTVTFDGSATASWTLSGNAGGASGSVTLSCQPQ